MHSSIVGGYVLVRPAAPADMATAARTILTVSDCIQDDLPRPEHWDWFQDPVDARRARTACPDARIVAVALEPEDAAELIAEMGGPTEPFLRLLTESLPADGSLLGFELVGAEFGLDLHSWHCHAYADDLEAATGIRVDDQGLLRSLADAREALRWMCSLPPERAPEPVPWFVVSLFELLPPDGRTSQAFR